jgi:hypothetical protein
MLNSCCFALVNLNPLSSAGGVRFLADHHDDAMADLSSSFLVDWDLLAQLFGHMPRRMDEIDKTIARRAYELFASRGLTDGHDLDDWFLAESQLPSSVT